MPRVEALPAGDDLPPITPGTARYNVHFARERSQFRKKGRSPTIVCGPTYRRKIVEPSYLTAYVNFDVFAPEPSDSLI